MTATTPAQPCGARCRLQTTFEHHGTAGIVCATGAVDASNCDTWQLALTTATAMVTPPGTVIVDTRQLDFMAICGYIVLAEAAQCYQRRGTALRLVSDQPIVAKVLAICKLSDLLPITPTVEAALGSA